MSRLSLKSAAKRKAYWAWRNSRGMRGAAGRGGEIKLGSGIWAIFQFLFIAAFMTPILWFVTFLPWSGSGYLILFAMWLPGGFFIVLFAVNAYEETIKLIRFRK